MLRTDHPKKKGLMKLIAIAFVLSVTVLLFGLYASLWWVLPIHIFAGHIGFLALFRDEKKGGWENMKTLGVCLLFGLMTLAVAAWVKKNR